MVYVCVVYDVSGTTVEVAYDSSLVIDFIFISIFNEIQLSKYDRFYINIVK